MLRLTHNKKKLANLLGEKILIKSGADRRSIPTILEKFSSDFITLPNEEEVKKKLKLMTDSKRNITSIRLISRSLYTFDFIYSNMVAHANKLKDDYAKSDKANKIEEFIPNFKIIAPCNYKFKLDSEKTDSDIESRDSNNEKIYSLIRYPLKGIIGKIRNETDELNAKERKYRNRLDILITASTGKRKIIQWKKADMNDFRILIVNYTDDDGINKGDVLVVASAKGVNHKRCALLSEEPYIVNMAANLFDSLFEKLP